MTLQSTVQAQKTLSYSVAALTGLTAGAALAAMSVLLLAVFAF